MARRKRRGHPGEDQKAEGRLIFAPPPQSQPRLRVQFSGRPLITPKPEAEKVLHPVRAITAALEV